MELYQRLHALARADLPNRRRQRYHGDDLCLPLNSFASDDQERLRTVYAYIQQLLTACAAGAESDFVAALSAFVRDHDPHQMMHAAVHFGGPSYAARPCPEMAKAIHDLRGGALSLLLGELQFAEMEPVTRGIANALYFLSRDHAKVMRNALLGLDDARRAEDSRPKIHGTNFLVEKWHGARLRPDGREVRLQVECPVPTAICECCLEFGALDRILYNLVGNACRHTSAGQIRLVMMPVPDGDGENLRLIVLNELGANERATLARADLHGLFSEGTSSTGSGYGLAIAAEFVAHAFGLSSAAEAVDCGYLGATLLDQTFAAWFHWPRVRRAATA